MATLFIAIYDRNSWGDSCVGMCGWIYGWIIYDFHVWCTYGPVWHTYYGPVRHTYGPISMLSLYSENHACSIITGFTCIMLLFCNCSFITNYLRHSPIFFPTVWGYGGLFFWLLSWYNPNPILACKLLFFFFASSPLSCQRCYQQHFGTTMHDLPLLNSSKCLIHAGVVWSCHIYPQMSLLTLWFR